MPFLINGNDYPYKPFAQPAISPNIFWFRNSAGRMDGQDFGSGTDKYMTDIVFEDTTTAIDNLATALNTGGRGTVTLSGLTPGMEPFGPLLDYSEDIEATIDPAAMRRYPTMGRMSVLSVRMRARSPVLLATTPSLATLRLQQNWEADQKLDLPTAFTYSQLAYRMDRLVVGGMFVGRFVQTLEESKAILAYLLVTARANLVPFPDLDVTNPFGAQVPDAGYCKIPRWTIRRLNLSMWEFQITFSFDRDGA